jgi:hypothetical protein
MHKVSYRNNTICLTSASAPRLSKDWIGSRTHWGFPAFQGMCPASITLLTVGNSERATDPLRD